MYPNNVYGNATAMLGRSCYVQDQPGWCSSEEEDFDAAVKHVKGISKRFTCIIRPLPRGREIAVVHHASGTVVYARPLHSGYNTYRSGWLEAFRKDEKLRTEIANFKHVRKRKNTIRKGDRKGFNPILPCSDRGLGNRPMTNPVNLAGPVPERIDLMRARRRRARVTDINE